MLYVIRFEESVRQRYGATRREAFGLCVLTVQGVTSRAGQTCLTICIEPSHGESTTLKNVRTKVDLAVGFFNSNRFLCFSQYLCPFSFQSENDEKEGAVVWISERLCPRVVAYSPAWFQNVVLLQNKSQIQNIFCPGTSLQWTLKKRLNNRLTLQHGNRD